jgi:zinc protease
MKNPLRTYQFAFRCGSAYDPPGKEGLASVCASLMAEGASATRSYKQILDEFFRMAARFQVQVDQELTVFSGLVHEDHAAAYEAIVQEMIAQPAFLAEDFERVRTDLISSLTVELRGSNDEELAKEMLYVRLYAGHPYGHPVVGAVSGLQAITLEDVRQFFRETLCRNEPIVLPEAKAMPGLHCSLIEKADARGVAMSFGHHIPVRRGHPDYHALLVAQCWLGQHRNGGRLFDSIREIRGLNYGDYAYLEYFPNGMFQFEPDPCLGRQQQIFQVWLRPVAPEKAVFALRLALYEIDQLKRNGMSLEDFERTRHFFGKYVKLLLKTETLVRGYALDSEFYGIGEYTSYISEGLARLTLEDVNRAARQYLDIENFHLVAVGPEMERMAETLRTSAATEIVHEVEQPEEVLAVDRVVACWPLRPVSVEISQFEEAFER